MAGLPSYEEIKAYCEAQRYTFDIKKLIEKYQGKNVENWKALADGFQRRDDREKAEADRRPPAFTMKKKKGNDMARIYRELFGDRAEEIYQARLRKLEKFKKSGCRTFREFEENEKSNS